jgi:cytochrome c oxidase subunit IV
MAEVKSLVLGEGSLNISIADASEQPATPQGREHKLDKTTSRPIRAVGFLLLFQAIGLIGLLTYGLLQIDWQQVRFDSQQGLELEIQLDSSQKAEEESMLDADRAILAAILFLLSIVLAILGALGFLFSRRGWLLASLAQTLILGACMELYYNSVWENPAFVYPIMLYCILMILYLNSSEVRVVFHSRRKPAKTVGQDVEVVHDSRAR